MKLDLQEIQSGEKFKLPKWKGYWVWDSKSNTVMMHCAGGVVIDIRDSNNVYMTLSNILSDDWEIAVQDNCPVLANELLELESQVSTYESEEVMRPDPLCTKKKSSVTKSDVLPLIDKEQFLMVGDKTTVCILTLINGYEAIGTSACVNPDNFNVKLGRKYANETAMNKLLELEGYRLHWTLMNEDHK